jgi:uncharacterized protein (DUF885 family)
MKRGIVGWCVLACAGGLALAASGLPAAAVEERPGTDPAAVAERFAQQYFSNYFKLQPTRATDLGIHDHDAALPDVSAAGHGAWQAMLRGYLAKAQAIRTADWPVAPRDDIAFLIASIKGEMLADETVRLWRKDPNAYLVLATESVFGLVKRNFAPQADRLRSVVAREQGIPHLLDEAKGNLTEPAHVYVEIALAQIDDTIGFFKTDLPAALADAGDPGLRKEFAAANGKVVDALGAYKSFLQNLLPKANAPFAIGRAAFQEKLLDEEMVDLPVEKILEVGMAQLRKDQATLAEAAHRIDPGKSVEAVLEGVRKDHVRGDQLLAAAKAQLDMLRRFVVDHRIVTVIGDEQPIVAETPPFMRATTFASMDSPAAFEKNAKESYYFITLPDPTWPAAKQEEYLQGYSTPLLQNVSVHEVWPGHFVQHLYEAADTGRSTVRKALAADSTVEGWAHYTELMMLDEGLGNGDPKLRLMQAIDALLRDARLVVGIRLHTMGMTLDEARKFFVEEGHQEPVVAEMETFRGTEDPTYLYYALGKLAILKLRDDYKARMGDRFTLLDFHDRFNRVGFLPLKLIRREIMGMDGPLL